jgi:hypothetical protein
MINANQGRAYQGLSRISVGDTPMLFQQRAVVAKLVVFDDGQCLEGLAEADAVGDGTAAQAFRVVDGGRS